MVLNDISEATFKSLINLKNHKNFMNSSDYFMLQNVTIVQPSVLICLYL